MKRRRPRRSSLKLRKNRLFQFTVGGLFIYVLNFSVLFGKEEMQNYSDIDPKELEETPPKKADNYTINFKNVGIIEYIKFVSKISNANFVFDEEELQFNVTIVSEEPISTKNIMSALIQVLRIHGLTLLEQDNNFIITKNTAVTQIPTIISSDHMDPHAKTAPIVTRIFRIKNANLNTVASIIRPMVSSTALIEVSSETKQLIVTDILTNVDKIASLLFSLDAPHTSLEVESYTAKNIAPAELITLATQIITPFADGNTLLFVPQVDTNTIYIVSTAYLIERAMTIMEDLDISSKIIHLSAENVFVYKILQRSGQDLEDSLFQIADDLKASPAPPRKLVLALESVRWIKDSNSLLFVGDSDTITKIKEILVNVDTAVSAAPAEGNAFYLYKLQFASGEIVLKQLEKIADHLPNDDVTHTGVVKTIRNMKWIKENNSLLITGPASALAKIQDLVAEFDVAGAGGGGVPSGKSSFVIYKPKNQSAESIQHSLENITTDLKESGLIDPDLLHTLSTVRYVPATNSLLLTGTPEALDKAQGLLETIDVVGAQGVAIQHIGNLTFLIYKLEHVPAAQFISSMKSVAAELDKSNVLDKELGKTIASMKWIKETNSILFTGTPQSLERIEELAKKFDFATGAARAAASLTYIVYTPKFQSGEDLINTLCTFENNLSESGVSDQGLFDAINNLKFMEQTASLIISGDAESIKKIEALLERFDVPRKGGGELPSIETIENTSFLVYKLQYHQGQEILTALKQVSGELGRSPSPATQSLVNSINSLQWITVTNSLLATGDQEVLTKLKGLIENLDVPLRQVFIEVLIIETSLANLQNFGVQWGGLAKYKNKLAMKTGNFPGANPFSAFPTNPGIVPGLNRVNATTFPNPATDIPFLQGFDLGSIGDIILHKGQTFVNLGALVNALQSDADTTILLNPKIITQDNNNSTIFVGQNIPYLGSQQTITGASNSTATNFEYRDIGMNLSITPMLGNGDIITLEISNDLSTRISASLQQPIPDGTILTTHTSLNTRVHVPNDHFIILSGMIQDTKTHFKSGIPCLGGLPVLGVFFSENDRSDSKDNLVIFLRPHIINSFEDYKALTSHQEKLYKEQATLPALKEDFDEAINLVKQPENE